MEKRSNLNKIKPNIAIFASGNGTNFESLMKADLPMNVLLVVSDNPDAYVIKRAEKYHVPVFITKSGKGITKIDREKLILNKLNELNISAIILAGYMKIIGETLLDQFPQKIINIHPALLPNFQGKQGILDAYNAKVDKTGVTIHFVDAGIDTGEIIAQVKVKRYSDDTLEYLEMRVHEAEHQLYPETILNLLQKGVL